MSRDSTQVAQPIKFPHFALVYTSISNCRVEPFYSLKATHTGLVLSECINKIIEMMITQAIPPFSEPSIREGGARLNNEAKLHFL